MAAICRRFSSADALQGLVLLAQRGQRLILAGGQFLDGQIMDQKRRDDDENGGEDNRWKLIFEFWPHGD